MHIVFEINSFIHENGFSLLKFLVCISYVRLRVMKYFHIISFLLPFSLNVYLNSSQQNSKQQCIYYYFSCNSHSLYYNIHIKGHFTRFFGTMSNNLILIPYYYFVLFAYLFYSTDMCLSSTCFTKFYMSSI